MALTSQQKAAREGKLTASAVACLMTGDEVKLLNLWRRLVGDPLFQEEDLDELWHIRLGETTEGLNLDWLAERRGTPITRRGEVVIHPIHDWAACTLDGWLDSFPIEAKHVGGFERHEVIVARYMPQLHWVMDCTSTRRAGLSVIVGAKAPVLDMFEYDAAYGEELWVRAEKFMECVKRLIPPVPLPSVQAPVPAVKQYDMAASNMWGSDAFKWLANKDAAKAAKDAEASLKKLVPVDAQRCYGHGIEITRNRAGHLTLKEQKK